MIRVNPEVHKLVDEIGNACAPYAAEDIFFASLAMLRIAIEIIEDDDVRKGRIFRSMVIQFLGVRITEEQQ